MSDDIWRWSASRVAAGIRRRDISAREALESCLGRMAAVNTRLNAVTVDLSDSAREAASRADAAVARGDALGPLHGVPVSIKENVDQLGCATTNGVVGFKNVFALEDSPVVANWKKAGAIILGRTNTPAFSFRLDTVNDLRGRTYNPWSRTHTPGGSSGGAASSVAAGSFVPGSRCTRTRRRSIATTKTSAQDRFLSGWSSVFIIITGSSGRSGLDMGSHSPSPGADHSL